MKIAFRKLHPAARTPEYETPLAIGADLFANIKATLGEESRSLWLYPGRLAVVKTGIAISLDPGYEAQLRPRFSLAAKNGVTALNAPGTIDGDYKGDINVLLLNTSDKPFEVFQDTRIAQLVIAPYVTGEFQETDRFD